MQKRNIGAWLLLLLFIGFWSSVILFPHTHIVDGQVLVHSHFSFDTSATKHSHTLQQIHLIAHLSLVVVTAVSFCSFLLRLFGRPFVFYVPRTSGRQNTPVRAFSLRAPPVR